MEIKWEEKIEIIKKRLKEIDKKFTEKEVINDPKLLEELGKEYKELKNILEKYESIKKKKEELEEISKLKEGCDKETYQYLLEEEEKLKKEIKELEKDFFYYFLPQGEDLKRNCIVEIRPAAGGEESCLFAMELFKMYQKYLDKKGFKYEILSFRPSDLGGAKEIIFLVSGEGAYNYLRFEQGVHRVQRVPITEASGRIHTSTVTVAVLMEPKEIEVNIKEEDLKIEVFRASSKGGQHVNVTDSAVRITHIPTGIVVSCQDERSQYQNRQKALKILKARLLEYEQRKEKEKIDKERRKQIGTGERAEKIRTYNFPQNRVTDHRIDLTLYELDKILEGNLDPIISSLQQKEIERLLNE
ncbi:MAG: peptide chain release factor 1 [candidate division WOR-3 bacterium]|nr:peptide chain release factor 1 [candidate division WOR-3 bacterium]